MKQVRQIKIMAFVALFIGIVTVIGGCAKSDDKKSNNSSASRILGKKNIEDVDKDGNISIGDKVTLGEESFYVISTDEEKETVKMITEWNLNVGDNIAEGSEGIQNSACVGKTAAESPYNCTVSFSETNYWNGTDTSHPPFVYSEKSSIYTYVENYATYLKEKGYSSVSASLISYEELVAVACKTSKDLCESVPSFIKNTSFWTGTAVDFYSVWSVHTTGDFYSSDYSYNKSNGVRPVITIAIDEI